MIQEALPDVSSNNGEVKKPNSNYSPEIDSAEDSKKSSTLIEFPGRRGVPEWRKQLSQRVRELQERKAREAAEELAAAQEAGLVSCALPSGQLELVPDLENPIVNPIVSKALERLERARRPEYAETAVAASTLTTEAHTLPANEEIAPPPVEPKPKLTVVAPPPPIAEPVDTVTEEFIPVEQIIAAHEIESIPVESIVAEPPTEIQVEEQPSRKTGSRKPIRVISDNDIALSYLENCLSVPALASDTRSDLAGLTRRFFAGLLDLIFIAMIVSPAAAAFYYYEPHLADPRNIGILSGITATVMFVYLTISTAMTGRTLGMRIFRMRTIDLRTGLIPTGGQSITRAITFVFSFALLGLGIAYALIDPDKRAVHDRLSKTIVIRS
jgi:uncharacterized RDD family membrane protein YckC